MTFNKLAAGRKVYGQGSYAPTRGQVSAAGAQGYLQREINKPKKLYPGVSTFGNDGQSDTRSGIVAQALARRQSTNPVKAPSSGIGAPNQPGGPNKTDPYGNPFHNAPGGPNQ